MSENNETKRVALNIPGFHIDVTVGADEDLTPLLDWFDEKTQHFKVGYGAGYCAHREGFAPPPAYKTLRRGLAIEAEAIAMLQDGVAVEAGKGAGDDKHAWWERASAFLTNLRMTAKIPETEGESA